MEQMVCEEWKLAGDELGLGEHVRRIGWSGKKGCGEMVRMEVVDLHEEVGKGMSEDR